MTEYNYNRIQFQYRNDQLRDKGYEDYQEFLKSDFWKELKEKLKQKPFYQKCSCCGNKEEIELHHINYKDILNSSSERFIFPVCRDCHQKIHNISREQNISFKNASRKLRKINNYVLENRKKTKIKLDSSIIPKKKKEKLGKVKRLGKGNRCPKCSRPMQRRCHVEKPKTMIWYEQWDYCNPCGHVQHYNQFKRINGYKEEFYKI
jgi:hypothetical protein